MVSQKQRLNEGKVILMKTIFTKRKKKKVYKQARKMANALWQILPQTRTSSSWVMIDVIIEKRNKC